jgi:Serine hydrolase (FSH1)
MKMKKILLLHGNCQTGELLLGRMDKLRKRLQKEAGIQLVAPSALLPHPDKAELRTWWNRNANAYEGLEMHFQMLQELWNDDDNSKEESSFVGIFGFSQGARLAHLMAVAHQRQPDVYFPGLRFVIMAAGYEAPLPDGFDTIVPARPLALATTIEQERIIAVRSLHVWGVADKLIRPDESKAQLCRYADPQVSSFFSFFSLHRPHLTLIQVSLHY